MRQIKPLHMQFAIIIAEKTFMLCAVFVVLNGGVEGEVYAVKYEEGDIDGVRGPDVSLIPSAAFESILSLMLVGSVFVLAVLLVSVCAWVCSSAGGSFCIVMCIAVPMKLGNRGRLDILLFKK